MAKRRTSRKSKRNSRKRTSRRNGGTPGVRAGNLIAMWKRSYAEKYGVKASDLKHAGEDAIARMHTLLDEGVPLKKAYEETVAIFSKDPEPVANFGDDVAHQFYLLVRDHGFTAEKAVIATRLGVEAPVPNRSRRRSRRKSR